MISWGRRDDDGQFKALLKLGVGYVHVYCAPNLIQMPILTTRAGFRDPSSEGSGKFAFAPPFARDLDK